MSAPVVEIDRVSKSFGQVKAVLDLSLTIGEGEYIALLGPNGAGKTTLVEMIEGIQNPDSGTITVLGKRWAAHKRDLQMQLGICLQETRLIDKLTVEETLHLFSSFYGMAKSRSFEIMEMVNLTEKRTAFVKNLSGGQRQRLALGISLLNRPRILLLDEPTTGLDPTARRDIWNILLRLRETGTTLILTTHYMEEAEVICDRIYIMSKGQFLTQGTLTEMIRAHGGEELIEFTLADGQPPDLSSIIPGVLRFTYAPGQHLGQLVVSDMLQALTQLVDVARREKLPITDIQCRRMTLDDLFVSLTGGHLHE